MGKRGRRRNQGHPARAAARKAAERAQRPDVPRDESYGPVWEATAARFPGVDPRTHALMTMLYRCDGTGPQHGGGCGWEHTVWLGLGVEAGKVTVPCPMFCGRCPDCDGPLSHVEWNRDVTFEEPTPIPAGVARFVLPLKAKAREFAVSGYGGAEYIDPTLQTRPPV